MHECINGKRPIWIGGKKRLCSTSFVVQGLCERGHIGQMGWKGDRRLRIFSSLTFFFFLLGASPEWLLAS